MKTRNLTLILTSLILFFSIQSYAATFTFNSAGNWSDPSNWDVYPGLVIGASDNVILLENVTIQIGETIDVNGPISSQVSDTIFVDGSFEVSSNFVQDGDIINDGVVTVDGGTYSINGRVTNNGMFTINTVGFLDFTFDNFGSLTIGASGDLNLTTNPGFVNKSAGIVTVDGIFAASAGMLNEGTMIVNGSFEKIKSISGDIINDGTITINGEVIIEGVMVNTLTNIITVNAGGVLTLTNDSSFTNFGTISISGEVNISNQSNFIQSGIVSIGAGGEVNFLDDIPSMLVL